LKEEAAPAYTDDQDNWPKQVEKDEEEIPEPAVLVKPQEPVVPVKEVKLEVDKAEAVKKEKEKAEPDFIIEERTETDEVAEKLVEDKGVYDPTLDLSKYKFPPLELLNEYDTGKVQVTQEELNQNKDKILATLT